MKIDPYFKYVAAIIIAGLVLACFSNASFAHFHIHIPGLRAAGAGGPVSWHDFKGTVKLVLGRISAARLAS
jgi:hypothetical protein